MYQRNFTNSPPDRKRHISSRGGPSQVRVKRRLYVSGIDDGSIDSGGNYNTLEFLPANHGVGRTVIYAHGNPGPPPHRIRAGRRGHYDYIAALPRHPIAQDLRPRRPIAQDLRRPVVTGSTDCDYDSFEYFPHSLPQPNHHAHAVPYYFEQTANHDSYESVAPANHDSYESVAHANHDSYESVAHANHDSYESVAPPTATANNESYESVAPSYDYDYYECTAPSSASLDSDSYQSAAPLFANPGPTHHDHYESVPANHVSRPAKHVSYKSVAPSSCSPKFRTKPITSDHFQPVEGHPGYFFNPEVAPSPQKKSYVASPPPSKVLIDCPKVSKDRPKSKNNRTRVLNDHPNLTSVNSISATTRRQDSNLSAIPRKAKASTVSPVDSTDLFQDGLETQGFIYEQPMDSYWKDKNRLDKLGAFNGERWETMRCIHFILPNMNHQGQAATPKQASVPHYQTSFAEIQSEIDSFREGGGVVEFKVYYPDRNYSNDFLHVVNLGVPEMEDIDWNALALLAYKENKSDKKRQHRFKDFGTTAGQCTSRVGSATGLSKPSKKPGTKQSCIVEAMVALSGYTKNAKYKWLPKGMRPFNCDSPDDPRNIFAQRFHKECCIPASRVGLTNLENPCRYHVDVMNSSMLQYQLVPTFAKIVVLDGVRYRCALIGYSRRSVDEFLARRDVHGNYVDFICDEYETFKEERKHLSPELFSLGEPVVGCIPKFVVLKNSCNLDPWGHYSSIIEATLLLDQKYKLNLPERLSLLRAMAVTPNSSYLYVAAATALLHQRSLNPKHRKKYRFGFLMARMMRDIHLKLINDKRQLPPRRFCCYAKYRVPDLEDWNHECDRLLLLHLTTPDPKLKSDRRTAYKEVRHSMANIFPYVDVLGGNHLVAIAGTLGLLPLWVTMEIEIHKGRSLVWLLEKFFEDKQERSQIKSDDVISNVMAALKTRHGCDFSKRSVENIVCKVFRRHTKNNSDDLFHDILLPKQNLYTVQGNHLRIMSADGRSTHKQKGPLLNMVPFGGKYITMEEVRAHVPQDWPSWDPTIEGLGPTFMEGLFNGRRDTYPDFQFEVVTKIPKNQWLLNKFVSTEKRMS